MFYTNNNNFSKINNLNITLLVLLLIYSIQNNIFLNSISEKMKKKIIISKLYFESNF